MTGLETAIRNAIARAGDPDRETRARIYASARMAVEKSLAKQEPVDPAQIQAQRDQVEAVISTVEGEFAGRAADMPPPAPLPAAPVPDHTVAEPQMRDAQDRAPEVMIDAASSGRLGAAPTVEARREGESPPLATQADRYVVEAERSPSEPQDAALLHSPARDDGFAAGRGDRLALDGADPVPSSARPAGKQKAFRRGWFRSRGAVRPREEAPARSRRRRGGGFAGLLAQLAILAVVVAGLLWWVSANGGVEQLGRDLVDSGADMLSEPVSGEPGTPAQRVGAGQFSGEWVSLFDPQTAEQADPGPAATVEAVEDAEEPFVRIVSINPGEEGEVRIPVDGEAAETLSSGPALIALTVRAAGDEPTQIYVRCSFPEAEGCGRRRFDVNQTPTDLLVDTDLSASQVEGGAIILNADVTGEGRGVELLSMRVRPAT